MAQGYDKTQQQLTAESKVTFDFNAGIAPTDDHVRRFAAIVAKLEPGDKFVLRWGVENDTSSFSPEFLEELYTETTRLLAYGQLTYSIGEGAFVFRNVASTTRDEALFRLAITRTTLFFHAYQNPEFLVAAQPENSVLPEVPVEEEFDWSVAWPDKSMRLAATNGQFVLGDPVSSFIELLEFSEGLREITSPLAITELYEPESNCAEYLPVEELQFVIDEVYVTLLDARDELGIPLDHYYESDNPFEESPINPEHIEFLKVESQSLIVNGKMTVEQEDNTLAICFYSRPVETITRDQAKQANEQVAFFLDQVNQQFN